MIAGITAGGQQAAIGPPIGDIEGYLPGLALNETYSRQLTADGATGWSITSGALPTGLTLNSSTGELSGVVPTGTTQGNYTFEVTASGGGPPATRSFTIGVGHYVTLLHMNGSNGGTSFPDETGKTWTLSGNAQTVTDGAALGGSAGSFDGSGDYLTAADDAEWTLGTDDFTLEFFATLAAGVAGGTFPGFIGQRTNVSSDHSFTAYLAPSPNQNQVRFAVNNGAVDLGGVALTPTTRQHVAISRRGLRLFFHVDGVMVTAHDFNLTVSNSGQSVRIAAFDNPVFSGGYYNGRLNEFRLMKGASRYAEADSFDPSDVVELSDFPVV